MSNFAKHHDELKEAVKPHIGLELSYSSIQSIFSEKHPTLNVAWVQPSDHCDNHSCKGACDCSETGIAIFSKISKGNYLVL